VTPNESMSDSILRQFRIMRQPNVVIDPDWGIDGSSLPGESNKMLSGESKSLFFLSTQRISKPIPVRIFREDQPNVVLALTAELNEDNCSADARARLCASRRIAQVEESEQQSLAVQYQLFTDKTAMTIVDEREVKSEGIPELRSVPQMPAAGHMGYGSSIVMPRSGSARMNMSVSYDSMPSSSEKASLSADMSFLDIPAFLRRSDGERDFADHEVPPSFEPQAFADWLNSRVRIVDGRFETKCLPTLDDLSRQIPRPIAEGLRNLVGSLSETQLVAFFLIGLFEQLSEIVPNRNIMRLARFEVGRIEIQALEIEIRELATKLARGSY